MSEDAELPSAASHALAEPVVPYDLTAVSAPRPRVRWGRAAALQIVAGGIAGFILPFWFFILMQLWLVEETGVSGVVIWIVICAGSGISVALFGAGIPLLSAWLSWLVVSRRKRGRRREVLAVVLGAIGGSLLPCALPLWVIAAVGIPWTYAGLLILLVGCIPGAAFALWVAGAWRRSRRAAPTA